MMQYKGYSGRVEFDDEADIFHGGEEIRGRVSTPNNVKC